MRYGPLNNFDGKTQSEKRRIHRSLVESADVPECGRVEDQTQRVRIARPLRLAPRIQPRSRGQLPDAPSEKRAEDSDLT